MFWCFGHQARRILAPPPGMEPTRPALKSGVLTTGPPLQCSWASLVAQVVKNPPAMQQPGFDPWVVKIPWRRERVPTPGFWPGEFHGL